MAVGLAWTPSGGDVLFVEANAMKGKGGFTMTGQIGQVMQESMQAALTWVRSNASQLGIAEDFFADHDIHMHVPAGAIPKDGPSAGVTMATTLVSLLSGHHIRPLTAMTGEITLSGNVLPVGGIKEKVLAAKRAGVTTVILPAENKMNVEEDLTPEQGDEGFQACASGDSAHARARCGSRQSRHRGSLNTYSVLCHSSPLLCATDLALIRTMRPHSYLGAPVT